MLKKFSACRVSRRRLPAGAARSWMSRMAGPAGRRSGLNQRYARRQSHFDPALLRPNPG
jgi:hypothetical protein